MLFYFVKTEVKETRVHSVLYNAITLCIYIYI